MAHFVYDALGPRERVEHGSGAVSYYTYDAASRLTNITHWKSDDSVIASFDYAHDPVGVPMATETQRPQRRGMKPPTYADEQRYNEGRSAVIRMVVALPGNGWG